jgi:hypothetical protein
MKTILPSLLVGLVIVSVRGNLKLLEQFSSSSSMQAAEGRSAGPDTSGVGEHEVEMIDESVVAIASLVVEPKQQHQAY